MKINIIQFDPVIGGETTLANSLVRILKKRYQIRIIHPVQVGKKGKPIIQKNWGKVEGEEFLPYDKVHEACLEADFVFCVNAKHVRGSKRSDKREFAQADSDKFFNQFHGMNFIFYEHGLHTWRLYNYENLFSSLMNNGNSIRVLTNTKAAISFYESKGYRAYLCRQPFNSEIYGSISRNDSDVTNICFNSRYSTTKGPHVVIPFFLDFIKRDLKFKFNFRGDIRDPVSIWHGIKPYFQDPDSEINIKTYADKIEEVYDKQDYTVYAGYQTKDERGKMEYAVLESIFYEIPIIAHQDVFDYFKYDEYGVPPDFLDTAMIRLNKENLKAIIDRKFDPSSFVKNAKLLLEDFMPDIILKRFDECITSPASRIRTKVKLF